MNVFIIELANSRLSDSEVSNEIRIEDNIGESIHIHHRNMRLEMSIKDFRMFAENVQNAKEVLKNGDC